MPDRYKFTNNQTGQTVEFDWHNATPPTEADIDAQFAAQAKPASEVTPPSGLSGAVQKAADWAITPVVDEATRVKAGGVVGGRPWSQPIAYQGIGDTIKGSLEGLWNLVGSGAEGNTTAQRAFLGGAAEGALSQSDPLTIASTALPVLKGFKAPALAVKLAKTAQAGLGGALMAGGTLQAADSNRSFGERIGGVGKAALGGVSMLGALPGKKAIPQTAVGTVGMDQVAADAAQAARDAAKTAKPSAATAFDPGGVAQQLKGSLVDVNAPLQRFEDQAAKAGAQIGLEESPANLAKLATGTGAKYHIISHDVDAIKAEAEKSGLLPILTHYLDLQGMSHAAEKIAGKSDQAWENLKAGLGLAGGYTHTKANKEIQNFFLTAPPELVQKVEQMGDQLFDMGRANLDRLHKAGFVDTEKYKELTKIGDNYIPQWKLKQTQLLNDSVKTANDTFVSSLDPVTQKVFKGIEGSDKMTQDPFEAMKLLMERSERLLAQNEVTTAIKNLASKPNSFLQSTVIPLKNVGKNATEAAPAGFRALHYWENGSRHAVAVPAEVADAITLANVQSAPEIVRDLFGKSMDAYRKLATTLNVPFSVANVVKDAQDARHLIPGAQQFIDPVKLIKGDLSNIAATGKFYGGFAKEVAAGLKDLALGKSLYDNPTYREMVQAGGGFSGMQSQIGLAKEYENNPILKALAEFSNRMEQTTKMYSWKTLKKAGQGDMEAALNVRGKGGSPDFAVKGANSRTTNLLLMFFNARMQGVARDLNYVLSNPKAAPGMALRKLAGPIATLTLFDQWNRSFRDEDGKLAIDKINNEVKKNNFIAVTPFTTTNTATGQREHFFVKFPMGHATQLLNSLASGVTEATGLTHNTTLPQAGADILANVQPVAQSLSGKSVPDFLKSGLTSTAASLNPLLKTPAELLTGYDMLRGTPIVPRRLSENPAETQQTSSTSPTASGLADIWNSLQQTQKPGGGKTRPFLPLSPMMLEHAMQSIPGLGELGLNLSDTIIGGKNGTTNPELMPLEERGRKLPFFGQLIRRGVGIGGSQVKNDEADAFYRAMNEGNSANRAKQDVLTNQGADAYLQFMEDNADKIAMNPAYVKISDSLAQIRQQKDMVRANASQIPDAKATLQALEQAERDLLEEFVVAAGMPDPRLRPTSKLGESALAGKAKAFMAKLGVK